MLTSDCFIDLEPIDKTHALEVVEVTRELPQKKPLCHADPVIISNPDYHLTNPYQQLVRPEH